MEMKELKIANLIARVPIIQGGMSVRNSMAPLAAAVAESGGIGIIGGSGIDADELAEEIRKAKSLTKGIVGVNIMFAITKFKENVLASIKAGVDVIFTGAGFSREVFKIGQEFNVPIVSIVSSAKFGLLAEKMGAAAVVVEGVEAGGHLGTLRPLKEIFLEVRAAVKKIPVIAAGGIMNGQDIAEYLKLGADGVQMATRFVATEECSVADSYKQAYIDAGEDDVVLIESPVGMPGRAIKNKFVDKIGQITEGFKCNYQCLKQCSYKYCIIQALINAKEGLIDEGLVFAGANVHKVTRIQKVKDLMDELVREVQAVPA